MGAGPPVSVMLAMCYGCSAQCTVNTDIRQHLHWIRSARLACMSEGSGYSIQSSVTEGSYWKCNYHYILEKLPAFGWKRWGPYLWSQFFFFFFSPRNLCHNFCRVFFKEFFETFSRFFSRLLWIFFRCIHAYKHTCIHTYMHTYSIPSPLPAGSGDGMR